MNSRLRDITRRFIFSDIVPVANTGIAVRCGEIDGLRGWAALCVVLFHVFWELFGHVIPGVRNAVSAFFLDGALAVYLFFIMSGEALSSAYFSGKGDLSIVSQAVKRYTRLTIPIAFLCAIIFIIGRMGLIRNKEASVILNSQDWLGHLNDVPLDLEYYVKYALFYVYEIDSSHNQIDPFLWTMSRELAGSFVVFLSLFLIRYIRNGLITLYCVIFFLSLINTQAGFIPCFLAGVVFAWARAQGLFLDIHKIPHFRLLSWVGIFIIAALDVLLNLRQIGRAHMSIIAIPLAFLIYCNRDLHIFLSNAFSKFLGSISFPLYLVQHPVIVSYSSIMAIVFYEEDVLDVYHCVFIAVSTVLICIAASYVFSPVEALTRRVGRMMVRTFVLAPDREPSRPHPP